MKNIRLNACLFSAAYLSSLHLTESRITSQSTRTPRAVRNTRVSRAANRRADRVRARGQEMRGGRSVVGHPRTMSRNSFQKSSSDEQNKSGRVSAICFTLLERKMWKVLVSTPMFVFVHLCGCIWATAICECHLRPTPLFAMFEQSGGYLLQLHIHIVFPHPCSQTVACSSARAATPPTTGIARRPAPPFSCTPSFCAPNTRTRNRPRRWTRRCSVKLTAAAVTAATPVVVDAAVVDQR